MATGLRTAPEAGAPAGVSSRRQNSLNLVRLVLALMVLVSHSHVVTGRGPEPMWHEETLGTWAVIGFFTLSGFLITGSRLGTTMGTYLVRRIARIYPGFLMCLVVTIVVLAPMAFLKEHGTLADYLTTPDPPVNYLINNVTLKVFGGGVAGTLAEAPFPNIWNGSLWTLYYEFGCYVIVGLLLCLSFVHRRPVLLVLPFVGSAWLHAHPEVVKEYTNGHLDVIFGLPLLVYFLGGGVAWVLREHIPLRWYVAIPAAAVWVAAVDWRPLWGGQAAAPLLAIVLLWVGQLLPSPAWMRRNDISYGCYVYAFPMQQLVVLFGIGTAVVTNIVWAALGTVGLATLSWYLVERPAMRAMRGSITGVDLGAHHEDAAPRSVMAPG